MKGTHGPEVDMVPPLRRGQQRALANSDLIVNQGAQMYQIYSTGAKGARLNDASEMFKLPATQQQGLRQDVMCV